MSWGSSSLASQAHVESVVVSFLRRHWPGLMEQQGLIAVGVVLHALRKPAHVLEYAVLAVLLFRAFRMLSQGPLQTRVLTTLTVCLIWASLDEVHQSLVATRTGLAADVLWDMVGALAGLAVVAFASQRQSQRASSLEPHPRRRSLPHR
jgi:VanZ family protein